MKKSIAMVCMGLASSVFAVDEYLPVAKGALEVDVAYNLMSSSGAYDMDGEKQDYPADGSIMGHLIPIQLKYGIISGLDVELLWGFQLASMSATGFDTSFSGFGQPEICLKYALMDIGVGAHVNYILPFATGDWADPDQPPMALQVGLLYTKLFMPQFNLTAMANYKLNFEGADSVKDGNVISVYAKPEFRFNQFGGAYLGLRYEMAGESEFDGTTMTDSDNNVFTLAPGWNATWLPTLSTEVNVPITLMGKNYPASFGVSANVYYTLGL